MHATREQLQMHRTPGSALLAKELIKLPIRECINLFMLKLFVYPGLGACAKPPCFKNLSVGLFRLRAQAGIHAPLFHTFLSSHDLTTSDRGVMAALKIFAYFYLRKFRPKRMSISGTYFEVHVNKYPYFSPTQQSFLMGGVIEYGLERILF